MKVEQVYEIVNQATTEFLGSEAMSGTAGDLSKVVDVGKTIIDEANDIDNYVRKLIDHIGKVVYVNRPYRGRAPSVLVEGWEYGSILEKIDAGIPEAEANNAWQLTNGTTYNQDVFTAPEDVRVKMWNKRVTFDIPMSFAYEQVKSAFSNVAQLNGFFSMIAQKIDTSLTIKRDALIMYTLDNFIAGTLYAEYKTGKYGDSSGTRAINLLYEYNQRFGETLTADKCLTDLNFLKYAAYRMKLVSNHLTNALTMYNIGGRVRHTPHDKQKVVLLDRFSEAANVYLQSDTFHNEFTKFPLADTVSFWQAPGTSFAEEDVEAINVKTVDPTTDVTSSSPTTVTVKAGGILGVIFDRDAVAVSNPERKVTQHYNARADFINSWYKEFAGYLNDFDENGVVFFVADPSSVGP